MLAAVDDVPDGDIERSLQELSTLELSLLPSTSGQQQRPASAASGSTPTPLVVQTVRRTNPKPRTKITGSMARAGESTASILTELVGHGKLVAARASLATFHSYSRIPPPVPPASTPSSNAEDQQGPNVSRRWRPSAAQACKYICNM